MIFLKPRKLPYPVWLRGPFTLDSSSLSSFKHLMYFNRKYGLWYCTPHKIKHVGQLHREDGKHWDSTAASKNSKPNPHSQKLLQKNLSYRKIVLMSLPPAILKARSVAKITVPCLDSTISRDFAFQHPLWKLCLHEGHRSSHKYQVTEGRTDGYGKGVGWERSIVKQRLRSAFLEEQGKGSCTIHPCHSYRCSKLPMSSAALQQ